MPRLPFGGQAGAGSAPAAAIYTLLDAHVAVGTEASYKFTPAATLLAADFSEIKTVMSFTPTAALAIRARFNSVTTADFNTEGAKVIGGVETIIDIVNQTNGWEICDASVATTNAQAVSCEVNFVVQELQDKKFSSYGRYAGFNGGGWFSGFGHPPTPGGLDFESIELIATASTWLAGTKIDTYGVTR